MKKRIFLKMLLGVSVLCFFGSAGYGMGRRYDANRKKLYHWVAQGNVREVKKMLQPRTTWFDKVAAFFSPKKRVFDINTRFSNDRTVLHWAIFEGQTEIVQFLLGHKDIDVNCKDNNGQSPLHWAIAQGRTVIIEPLLSHKDIDVNSKDDIGRSPLHWAILMFRKYTMLKLFLERLDININIKDKDGQTPLHLAAINNCIIPFKFLALMGARLDLKNKDGEKPRDKLSEENGDKFRKWWLNNKKWLEVDLRLRKKYIKSITGELQEKDLDYESFEEWYKTQYRHKDAMERLEFLLKQQ